MKLSKHDLSQIDEDYLKKCIESGKILEVSVRLLQDLKEAMDRLNQTPDNSSRPPSSRAPWESVSPNDDCSPEGGVKDTKQPEVPSDTTQEGISPSNKPSGKKAGKQHGAKGYGRTQKLAITHTEHHYPATCAACGVSLSHDSRSYTGWNEVDIAPPIEDQTGLFLICTRHLLYESRCTCGHATRAKHFQACADPLWENIELGQWRLIGPRLAAAIVFLSFRMHLSRARIQEFFIELLGLSMSIGVIDETLREAGRAAAPLEDELVESIEQAVLLNIDETSWKESGQLLWLWVFASTYTVLYYIGPRTLEMLSNVVTEAFEGMAMTDGYHAYRHLKNRLRCWAHLLRKLQGLADSTDKRVADVGKSMLNTLCAMMEAIYIARSTAPPTGTIAPQCEDEIALLRKFCEDHRSDSHAKLGAVAREFLLDWEVILRQAREPDLPFTNNAAERALRHWVIARRISLGTRSESGSRAFALMASVIDTCRRRGVSAWLYLASVIAAARKGIQVPCLPLIPMGR
jgi:transposase